MNVETLKADGTRANHRLVFDTFEEMTAAEERMRDDPRVLSVKMFNGDSHVHVRPPARNPAVDLGRRGRVPGNFKRRAVRSR